jgi:hypothetical protein
MLEEIISMWSEEKLLVDSDMGGIGPCLLPSHDAEALDFTVLML